LGEKKEGKEKRKEKKRKERTKNNSIIWEIPSPYVFKGGNILGKKKGTVKKGEKREKRERDRERDYLTHFFFWLLFFARDGGG
jgi:hypothetical protein